MHRITFFPLGNADCCRIDLQGGEKLLFDCAATRDPNTPQDLRCDLHQLLRDDLDSEARDYFDVVVFTHLDRDHFARATEFFHLDHARKYQGAGRIKINTIWVPAAVITEQAPDDDEARIIQAEARHRFREGAGIRVFSRPERLREWCEKHGIDLEDRLHLISDAGRIVPDFSLEKHGAEFFVHSPFAVRQDDNSVEDRNSDGIVVQATFSVDGTPTKVLLMADADHGVLSDIVSVSVERGNAKRLEWSVAKLPHHCSYLSLGPEKGAEQTEPVAEVAWLYEEQATTGAIVVSTSRPIPVKGSKEDVDAQPPHRQAANYYQAALESNNGEFVATMEHPNATSPEPLVIEMGARGATLKLASLSAPSIITSRPAPRAG